MKSLSSLSTRARSGFTLIELMAATGIMIVIMLMVLTLTSNVLTSWNRASGDLAANAETRMAMDMLARDLESAVIQKSKTNQMWLYAVYESALPGDPLPGNIDSTWLQFLTASAPDRPTDGGLIYGDVNAVSYRLAYQNPIIPGGVPMFALYRSIAPADLTFTTFMPDLEAAWSARDSDSVDISMPASSSDVATDIIAMNVLGFSVTFNITWMNGGELFRESITLDTDASSDEAQLGNIIGGPNDGGFFSEDLYNAAGNIDGDVESIDVSLTILSDKGQEVLSDYVANGVTFDWDDFKMEYADSFTRRIPIHTGL